MMTGMVARPSRPSVRFTALPNATTTKDAEDDIEGAKVDDRSLVEGDVELGARSPGDDRAADAGDGEFGEQPHSRRTPPCGSCLVTLS